jgi:hypothetical protein
LFGCVAKVAKVLGAGEGGLLLLALCIGAPPTLIGVTI